jgi:hypothetical protein
MRASYNDGWEWLRDLQTAWNWYIHVGFYELHMSRCKGLFQGCGNGAFFKATEPLLGLAVYFSLERGLKCIFPWCLTTKEFGYHTELLDLKRNWILIISCVLFVNSTFSDPKIKTCGLSTGSKSSGNRSVPREYLLPSSCKTKRDFFTESENLRKMRIE